MLPSASAIRLRTRQRGPHSTPVRYCFACRREDRGIKIKVLTTGKKKNCLLSQTAEKATRSTECGNTASHKGGTRVCVSECASHKHIKSNNTEQVNREIKSH